MFKFLQDLQNINDEDEFGLKLSKKWKRAKMLAWGWSMVGVFFIVFVWDLTNTPVLDLNEMKVTEGVVVKAYPEVGRSRAKVVLRKDDGTLFSVEPYKGESKGFEERVGERFKVWSQRECNLLKFFCLQQMVQIEYQGHIVLDYEKTVRPPRDAFAKGIIKYVFYLFPLFFFLIAIGTLEGIGKNIKKCKKNTINGMVE